MFIESLASNNRCTVKLLALIILFVAPQKNSYVCVGFLLDCPAFLQSGFENRCTVTLQFIVFVNSNITKKSPRNSHCSTIMMAHNHGQQQAHICNNTCFASLAYVLQNLNQKHTVELFASQAFKTNVPSHRFEDLAFKKLLDNHTFCSLVFTNRCNVALSSLTFNKCYSDILISLAF
jgi:hypothetical protein